MFKHRLLHQTPTPKPRIPGSQSHWHGSQWRRAASWWCRGSRLACSLGRICCLACSWNDISSESICFCIFKYATVWGAIIHHLTVWSSEAGHIWHRSREGQERPLVLRGSCGEGGPFEILLYHVYAMVQWIMIGLKNMKNMNFATSKILAVGKSLLLLPLHDLQTYFSVKASRDISGLEKRFSLHWTWDWGGLCKKHRGGISLPTRWASYHSALWDKAEMLFPETTAWNVIWPLHPPSDSNRLYRREGSKAQGWLCQRSWSRVTLLTATTRGGGDADDFYKSGAGGTHAACRHTVTPTNCLLNRGCPNLQSSKSTQEDLHSNELQKIATSHCLPSRNPRMFDTKEKLALH